jgi:SNF2 family DNA or RNA helicase
MGGVSTPDRDIIVNRFQNDPRYRLFIGQTIAAGTSITLSQASTVLVIEPDWLPHNDYQAISRVHRISQTEPVFVYRAYVENSVDQRIHFRAAARYRDFCELMDGLVTTH